MEGRGEKRGIKSHERRMEGKGRKEERDKEIDSENRGDKGRGESEGKVRGEDIINVINHLHLNSMIGKVSYH